MRLQNILYYLVLPGIFIHEIAHAFIVWILPDVWITELDLTSHVEYEGYYMTATRTFLIAYAPLFFNTIISISSVYLFVQINTFESISSLLISILLVYIALVTAFTAFPSKTDAIAPLNILRTQLFTRRFPLIILLSPFFVLLSVPGLAISYTSHKSVYIQIILCLIYTVFVFLIGFEIITIDMIVTELSKLYVPIESYINENYNI